LIQKLPVPFLVLDFVDLTPTSTTVLHGITSGLAIEGKGTLRWSIMNDAGDEIDLYIRDSLYVSSAPMFFLSPQQFLRQTNYTNSGFNIQNHHGTLQVFGHKKTVHYNKNSYLPIFFTAPKITTPPSPTFTLDLSSSTTAVLTSEN
jgi:hypothetical protein